MNYTSQINVSDVPIVLKLGLDMAWVLWYTSGCGPLAQVAEHLPFKQGVAGSNPARLTSYDMDPVPKDHCHHRQWFSHS